MKEVQRADIALRNGRAKVSFKNLYYNDNKLTLLTSTPFRKGAKMKIFVQNLDIKTLNPLSEPKPLTEFTAQGKLNDTYGMKSMFSLDESKFLVFRNESNRKNEKTSYFISVFDANNSFQELWSGQYQSEGIDKLEDIEVVKVKDDGTVYIMVKQFDGKRTLSKGGQANYKFKLKEISNNGESINEIDIDLKDEFITQLTFGINQNDDIVCTGFYSSKASISIKGCFYLLMDHKTKSVVKESKKDFEIDFITSEMKDRQAAKLKKKKEKGKDIEMPNFVLRDIVLVDNGGVVQVAERYFVTTSTTTDANGNRFTTYTYHFEEVIVISITPEGNIEWARKIPKRQVVGNPNSPYISYHLSVLKDKLYFFHNGNAENLIPSDKKRVRPWLSGKKATGIITEINSEGYIRKDVFYDYAGHQAFALMKLTTDFENEIMFLSVFKKKIKFLKLKIND